MKYLVYFSYKTGKDGDEKIIDANALYHLDGEKDIDLVEIIEFLEQYVKFGCGNDMLGCVIKNMVKLG